MSAILRRISGLAAIGYGVNIFELASPGSIAGAGSNVVGVVADLPWGPVNTKTSITATGQLFDTFAPLAFGASALNAYAALKAFMNKGFPNLQVVRTAPTGQAAATQDYDDEDATESITVTARYPGALGNQISVAWAANADTAANRDAIVSIGTGYSARYENVITSTGVLTDPADPFVTFTKHANYAKVPEVASAVALASGSDGTSAAADYTGAGVGIAKFAGASSNVNLLFCAEVPSAQVDAVNAGLKTYADTYRKGQVVYSTPAGQTVADAKTYLTTETLRASEGRSVYSWPRVNTRNTLDPANALVDVDPNAFVASCIAQHDPHLSPGGASSAAFLGGISSLVIDTATATDYDELNAAGVAPIYIDPRQGAILRKGVTTDLTSGQTKISSRRMKDYILGSIADRAAFYVEEPLDITLNPQSLGPSTGAFVGECTTFLDGLLRANGGPQIAGFDPVDPYSGNSQANLDADQWFVIFRVKLLSSSDSIVLVGSLGEAVVLQEAA